MVNGWLQIPCECPAVAATLWPRKARADANAADQHGQTAFFFASRVPVLHHFVGIECGDEVKW